MVKREIRFILVASLILALVICNSGVTGASFSDGESSIGNVLRAWLSNMWVQTSQADFAAGVLNNVDITTSSGDVRLASPSDWYHSDWGYRRAITIDHTQVQDVADPSSTYADFPILVYMTGLSNINANGTDIRFTSSDGTTELSREIESYAGGALYAWVKVTLTKDSSDSSDDVIYMYYGNGSATEPAPSSPYGSESTWDTDFVMVQHLEETSGTHFDSTSYSNDSSYVQVTQQGTASGKINGTDEFDGIDDYITIANSNDINIGTHGQRTVSAWFNVTDTITRQVIFEEGGGIRGLNIYIDGGNLYVGGWNETVSQSNWQGTWLSTAINPDTWYHVVVWLDGGSVITPNALKGYLNGVEFGSGDGSQLWSHSGNIQIGRNGNTKFHDGDDNSAGEWLDGLIDEVQISNTPRSAEWIRTCYNNQDTPGSFYSVAGEENPYVSPGTLASQVFDSGAGAGWYDAAWSYRRPVTLSPATSVADYQVLVTLTTAVMGNPYTGVNADGSDIRFTGPDGATLQDYWIESWDNTGTSKIWVEVQTSGTTAIFMYYGNAAAGSTSDGDATFVFFDDFPGTTLDGTKWGSWAATVSVAGSVVTITNTGAWGGIASINEYSLPYRFVARAQKTTEYGIGQVGMEKWYVTTGDDTMNIFDVWGGTRPQAYITSKYDDTDEWDEVGTWELNTWYHYEIAGKSDEVKYYRDGILENTETNVNAIPAGTMFLLLSSEAVNDQLIVDYCFIGKYVSPEPTTGVGSQELPDTTSWIGLSWDETLASNTDITFEVRASDTPFLKDDVSPSWIAVGGTSPVVAGLPSGRYMQWRATLTTSDPANTPILHEVIVIYD